MADLVDQVFGEPEAVAEPEVIDTPQPVAEPEPVVSEPAPAPAPEPVKDEPKDHMVPLRVMLSEREEKQELKRRLAEYEAKAQQPAPSAPDPIDDPDGYRAYQDAERARDNFQVRFDVSEEMATEKYGEDSVKEAVEWGIEKARQSPAFAAEYWNQKSPVNWIVRQHKRDALYSQLPTDVNSLDEYIEREIARRSAPAAVAAPVAAIPSQSVKPPPRSIASDAPAAPSATSGGDFMDMFKR